MTVRDNVLVPHFVVLLPRDGTSSTGAPLSAGLQQRVDERKTFDQRKDDRRFLEEKTFLSVGPWE